MSTTGSTTRMSATKSSTVSTPETSGVSTPESASVVGEATATYATGSKVPTVEVMIAIVTTMIVASAK